jgi:hypothetical protein
VKTTELEGVPTSVSIADVRRRIAELADLKSLMGGTDTDTKGRKANSKLKAAAVTRWSGWKSYKAEHPNATPKQYFK